MATNKVLTVVGTQIIFADHGTDFVGGADKTSLEVATATDVQIDLTTLGDDGGRESVKFDFGAARAPQYSCMAAIEADATGFTTGESIDFFLAPSSVSGATDGNPGQIDGADAAAPSGAGTLNELLVQCMFIGSLVVENTVSTIQVGHVGVFSPPERYGILIVVNRGGQAFLNDAVEHHVVFNPIIPDIQAAA